jgi:uncharacterized protein
MMRLTQIRLKPGQNEKDLLQAVLRRLGLAERDLAQWTISRRSIDARRRSDVFLTYSVDVHLRPGCRLPHGLPKNAVAVIDTTYEAPRPGPERLSHRPMVVGAGPAGLFAALRLALSGFAPRLIERGRAVEERLTDVNRFWKSGELLPESNLQFGEGGAGTFSDGKLATGIRDIRCRWVLEQMVAAGAPPDILYEAKPHVGTDRLQAMVINLRRTIIAAGGEVRFNSKLDRIVIGGGRIRGAEIAPGERIPVEAIVLAIGHGARDTYARLHESGIPLEPKPFAVGVRIEHPQELIDRIQFGRFAGHPDLGAADYKLAVDVGDGRSAYTFCMCPGGSVVASASEPGGVVTNGMSFRSRNGKNANSALLVTVTPADFFSGHPLAGVEFQRRYEQLAYAAGGGGFAAPVQLLRDFVAGVPSGSLGCVTPSYLPGVTPTDLASCLPIFVTQGLRRAIPLFDSQMAGFALPEAVLTGVESRSSAPLRILRGPDGESSLGGLFPAGEGAGYAGGIMSSAVDGIRAAEAIIRRYAPAE